MERITGPFVLSFLLLTSIFVKAQNEIPFIHSFNNSLITCPFNDTISLNSTIGWYGYYTLDDTYSGIIDSAYCVDLNSEGYDNVLAIPYADIDTSRTLFLRARFNDANKISLGQNDIQYIYVDSISDKSHLKFGTDCYAGICTGFHLGIEIPDSTGTTTAMRWYPVPFESLEASMDYLNYKRVFCYMTENFPEQFIREFIYQFTFSSVPDTGIFYMQTAPLQGNDDSYDAGISDLRNTYMPFVGDHYEYRLSDLAEYYNSMGLYYHTFGLLRTDTTYPSPEHIGLIEMSPDPNPSIPSVIDFYVDDNTTLLIQLFTNLVGDFAEGDTVRHTVNIIQDGGNICLGNYMDVIPRNAGKFIYKSGMFNLSGPTACLRFQDGAMLEVGKGSTLHYSKNGIGMMALHNTGKIVLDDNAELDIGAQLFMFGTKNNSEQVYVNLNPGNVMRFTDGSKIQRMNDEAADMYLYVYMNGGLLDDAGLSDTDKGLIKRIYPADGNSLSDRVSVHPNPLHDVAILEMQSEQAGEAQLSLTDVNGNTLRTETAVFGMGLTPIYFSVKDLADGIYFLSITVNGETTGKKILKV